MVLKIKEIFDTIVNWRSLINVNALALIKVNILLSSVGRESWVTVILLLQVCFDKLLELTSPLIYQLNIAETNVHSIARSTRATYIPNWSLLWFKHKCMVLLSNNCILIYFALFFRFYTFSTAVHIPNGLRNTQWRGRVYLCTWTYGASAHWRQRTKRHCLRYGACSVRRWHRDLMWSW